MQRRGIQRLFWAALSTTLHGLARILLNRADRCLKLAFACDRRARAGGK